MSIVLACPSCHTPLDEGARCPACSITYQLHDGVWRFLSPERAAAFDQFQAEYQTVRRDEGWGSLDAAYYRGLPLYDLSGRFNELWRIRAISFKTLLRTIGPSRRRVLDLGAGNGWLSYQLARRGHDVIAIDIQTDEMDGLGARKHYDAPFIAAQAEFDRLPLSDGQADLVVFNGALHYSTDYVATLTEALRVLAERGRIAILDSPMYPSDRSGAAMVDERRRHFSRLYGFTSDGLASQHYLTPTRIEDVGRALGISWQIIKPFRGWRWVVRPWWARLLGRRVPADFPVILGRRS
jgi:ubiquinone/menaquinone biosynthesis C-methylase UbiE/uncharacterized protein YbaR (Trm112 family)